MSFASKSLTLLLATTVLNSAYSSNINVINNINDLEYKSRSYSLENINHKNNENGLVKNLDYLQMEKKAYRMKDGKRKIVRKNDEDNRREKRLQEIIVTFKEISGINEEINVLKKNKKSLLGLNELITYTSELECKQRKLKSLKTKTKTLLIKFNKEEIAKCNISNIINKKSIKKLLYNAQIPSSDAKGNIRQIKIENDINRIFDIENVKLINQNNNTQKIRNNILKYLNNKIQSIDTNSNTNSELFEESISSFIKQNNYTSKIKTNTEENKNEIITEIVNTEINEFINDLNDKLQKPYQRFIDLKEEYLKLFEKRDTQYVFKYDSNKFIQHLLNSKHIGQNRVITFSHKKKWNLSEKTLIGGITDLPNYRSIMDIINMTWNGNKESPDIKDEYKKEIYYIIENYLVIPCIRDIFDNNINNDNSQYFVKFQNADEKVCKLKVTSEYKYVNSLVLGLKFNEQDRSLITFLITMFGEDEKSYKDNKNNYEVDITIENRIKAMQSQNSMIIKKHNELLKDKKPTDKIKNLLKLNKIIIDEYGNNTQTEQITKYLTKLNKEELTEEEYKNNRKQIKKVMDKMLTNVNAGEQLQESK